MKKLFLTSGIIACMACPAFATTGFTPSDLDTDTYTGTGGTSYTPAQSGQTTVTNGCVTGNIGTYSGSTSFIAQWQADPYKIIYKAGTTGSTHGHDFTQTQPNTATSGLVVVDSIVYDDDPGNAKAADTFSIYGYHFDTTNGWASDRTIWSSTPAPTNTTAAHYAPGSSLGTAYNVTSDTILTARWAADTYTVEYSCDGGDADGLGTAPASHTATYDSQFTFRGNKDDESCHKNGYHFDHWDCGNIVGNHATANDPTGDRAYGNHPGDTVAVWEYAGLTDSATITCNAVYAKNVVALTWGDSMDNTTYAGGTTCTYDENIVLPETPTKTGYTFTGWTATGTTDPNLDGNIATPAQSQEP